jgi:hypothetical protein
MLGVARTRLDAQTAGLRDSVLLQGGKNRIFLVNKNGYVLVAAVGQGSPAFFSLSDDSYAQSVAFKHVAEMNSLLTPLRNFNFGAVPMTGQLVTLPKQAAVAVIPISDNMFLLVLSEITPFVDVSMEILIIVCLVVSGLPFLAAIALAITYILKQKALRERIVQRQRDMQEAQKTLLKTTRGSLSMLTNAE